MKSDTPYTEGHRAGYLDMPRQSNPYRRGIPRISCEVEELVQAWDDGWYAGNMLGRSDVMDKRRAALTGS